MTTHFLPVTPTMRQSLERAIDGLIALLDTLDPDADDEPSLGSPEYHPASFESHWGRTGHLHYDNEPRDTQEHWAAGGDDEREDENEHGGDICDEPHDTNELEPFLSSTETYGQGIKIGVTPWKERDAAFGPGGIMDGWQGHDGE